MIGLWNGKHARLASSPKLFHTQPQGEGPQSPPTGEVIPVKDELHEEGRQQHDCGALESVVPELGESAEVCCYEAGQYAQYHADWTMHDGPYLVAFSFDCNVYKDGVACDADHVIKAGSCHNCCWNACSNTSETLIFIHQICLICRKDV